MLTRMQSPTDYCHNLTVLKSSCRRRKHNLYPRNTT